MYAFCNASDALRIDWCHSASSCVLRYTPMPSTWFQRILNNISGTYPEFFDTKFVAQGKAKNTRLEDVPWNTICFVCLDIPLPWNATCFVCLDKPLPLSETNRETASREQQRGYSGGKYWECKSGITSRYQRCVATTIVLPVVVMTAVVVELFALFIVLYNIFIFYAC